MNIHEIHRYRDDKDHAMRHGYESPRMPKDESDRYTNDMFGGAHGIDPSSHGAELQ